jgi:hypothetical protein
VKSHLSREQWTRYPDEIEKRTAHRKRTALRNLLERLDRELFLTGDQRNKIGAALAARWNATWESLDVLIGDGPLPERPRSWAGRTS